MTKETINVGKLMADHRWKKATPEQKKKQAEIMNKGRAKKRNAKS